MAHLFAGASRLKLDPPVGIAMAGYGRRVGRSHGIHDDLAAQAIVLSDGVRKAAIVSVDVLAMGVRICDAIAARIEAETGIAAQAVMVCATHTHSGPHFNIFSTPSTAHPPAAAVDRDLAWERSLPDRIVAAVADAARTMRPAIARAGAGRFGLGTNRRLLRADGSIQLAPNHAGVADNELLALGLYEAGGDHQPIAILFNYPCHGVVLCEDNLLYSRDWPGFAADAIERMANARNPAHRAIAVFTQGSCGNIDPRSRGNFEIAKREGTAAASTVMRALDSAAPLSPVLRTTRVPLTMKLRDLSASLSVARANVAQTEASLRNHREAGGHHEKRLRDQHRRSMEELAVVEALDAANRRDKRVDLQAGELATHMTIVRVGEIAMVGIPGELFVELGLAIKANPLFRHTMVVGYCNDLAGYFPTREAYRLGGYEVETSRVAAGSGERIVQEALGALEELAGDEAGQT